MSQNTSNSSINSDVLFFSAIANSTAITKRNLKMDLQGQIPNFSNVCKKQIEASKNEISELNQDNLAKLSFMYQIQDLEVEVMGSVFQKYIDELETTLKPSTEKTKVNTPPNSTQVIPNEPEVSVQSQHIEKRKINSENTENQENPKKKKKNFQKDSTDHLNLWCKYNIFLFLVFNHLNDPYPNDEEKKILAQQTNLTLSQINNWFGNKRMRYKRKMLEQSKKPTPQPDNTNQ